MRLSDSLYMCFSRVASVSLRLAGCALLLLLLLHCNFSWTIYSMNLLCRVANVHKCVHRRHRKQFVCVCVCVYTTIASNSYSFVVWWCRVADSALSRMNIQNEKYWAKLLSLLCCVCISNDNAATMFSTMSAALVLSVGLLCRCENC